MTDPLTTPGPARPPGTRGGHARVDVADPEGRLNAADGAWLREMGAAALKHLDQSGEVRVRVVGDAAMSAAHERYCQDRTTTDVLTFDLRPADSPPTDLDVDILVCIDEAGRQAAARNLSTRQELLLYIVHGVLHCLGHDDHDARAAATMHGLEDEILRAIGAGVVFAAPTEGKTP